MTNNSITVNNSLHQYSSGCANLQIRIENKLLNTSHWQADELQGKVGQCFLSDSKVRPQVHIIKDKAMNQAIIASVPMAPMQMPVVRRRRVKVTEPEIKLPPRGSRGPVHISELLNPILEISKHPDRNRLLAEFFNQ